MTDITRGVLPARDTVLLETYLQELGYLSIVDGKLDANLKEAVRRFQRDHGLFIDGIAGEKTWTRLFAIRPDLTRRVSDKWLSRNDLESTASRLGLPVATVRAVYKVESGGSGFWALRPKILFEGHVFWGQLKKLGKDPAALRPGFEDVLYPKWDRTRYVGGPGEYARLERAQQIDRSAALESASWGLFQIMGFHAVGLGYGSVEKFVEEMGEREGTHLDAFGRFIERARFGGRSLLQWLHEHNWARFAEGYNGPGFKKNKYDEKLQRAYAAAVAEG